VAEALLLGWQIQRPCFAAGFVAKKHAALGGGKVFFRARAKKTGVAVLRLRLRRAVLR
jgi:hypothetical protein